MRICIFLPSALCLMPSAFYRNKSKIFLRMFPEENCGCSVIICSMLNAQRLSFVLFFLLVKLPRLALLSTNKGEIFLLEFH